MNQPTHRALPQLPSPLIQPQEVQSLAARYGAPLRRAFSVQADDYLRSFRFRNDSDRRAEVVFALQDRSERIWVHAKTHYPAHIYRLPSGGVHWEEAVEDALLREIAEETGLSAQIERFVGIIETSFHAGDATAYFASYLFLLRCQDDALPQVQSDEDISAFRTILPGQLPQISADLRNLIGDRRGWGQWRALAHDLVYEVLTR